MCSAKARPLRSTASPKRPKTTHLGLEPPRQRFTIFDSHTEDLRSFPPRSYSASLRPLWPSFYLAQRAFYHRCPPSSTTPVGCRSPARQAQLRRWFADLWQEILNADGVGRRSTGIQIHLRPVSMCGDAWVSPMSSSCFHGQSAPW